MLRSRVAALAGAGLLLAACGQVHPGSAAVVDGTRISMKSVQRNSVALCEYALAQGSITSVDNAEARRQALSTLIYYRLADNVAKARGIKVAAQVVPAATVTVYQKQFGAKADQVLELVKASERYASILTSLGRTSLGAKASSASSTQLTSAGEAVIMGLAKKSHISTDPRFGLHSLTSTKTTTGSLSVKVTSSSDVVTSSFSKCQA